MKTFRLFTIFLFIIFASKDLIAQEYTTRISDCNNYNYFIVDTTNRDSLNFYTDTIFEYGTILLDFSYSHLYNDPNQLVSTMINDSDITFEFTNRSYSPWDTAVYYERFQQFYKDIEVLDGGYVLGYKIAGPNDDDGPCDIAYSISPYVITGMDTSILPTVDSTELYCIICDIDTSCYDCIDSSSIKANLKICTHLNSDCNSQLTWIVSYTDSVNLRGFISYIDATTGEVIKTTSNIDNLLADTKDYGEVTLDDAFDPVNNKTYLQSEDGTLRTLDYGNWGGWLTIKGLSWSGWLISTYTAFFPRTSHTTKWQPTDGSVYAYQAHHVMTVSNNVMSSLLNLLNINLGRLNVAGNVEANNAGHFKEDDPNEEYFYFGTILGGENDGKSYATYEIAGHEFAHAIIQKYIDSKQTSAGGAIHEGLADVFGEYIDYIYNSTINYIHLDPLSNSVRNYDRDFKSMAESCYTDYDESDSNHDRGRAISTFFYLVANGDQTLGIPGIGIEQAFALLTSTMIELTSLSDIYRMREISLKLVMEKYPPCSDEFITVMRAWCNVCVDENNYPACDYGCDFDLDLTSTVICEEDNSIHICLEGDIPPVTLHTRWTWIAKDALSWIAAGNGNQSGTNQVEGGLCLSIIDLPDYPYYPQHFTVKFYSPQLGSKYILRKDFKILDCDGQDPTCEEYYNNNPLKSNPIGKNGFINPRFNLSESHEIMRDSEISYIKLFDIYGKEVLSKNLSYMNLSDWQLSNYIQDIIDAQNYSGIYVMCYFNQKRMIVLTEKISITR